MANLYRITEVMAIVQLEAFERLEWWGGRLVPSPHSARFPL
jgi:hypothetical protein